MSLPDRIARSVFVALAVGLGWGIRGDFGHVVGAMFPGACLGLALAYVSGQRSLFLWMPVIAGLSAFGIGVGGSMSYGILHGYAQADTLVNYSYGFLTLFLQGSAWGTFGGALIGLVLERKPLTTSEWLGWLASIFLGGFVTVFVVVQVLGFQINPPRNNSSIAFMGAAIVQIVWLAVNGRTTGLRGAVLGYVGFGLGMSLGRLLGNIAHVAEATGGFTINHWNVMETSCGLIGGFIYAFGMVDRAYPAPAEEQELSWPSVAGIIYVLGLIPLWHRLARVPTDKAIEEWTNRLTSYGYDEPAALAAQILWWLDGVCVLGFLGAFVWMIIHYNRWQRLAAFPVLWLCITMTLFQNLHALYFFYPRQPNQFNMHSVFWVLVAGMLVYAVVSAFLGRPLPTARPLATDKVPDPRFPWLAWLAGGFVASGVVIVAAGFVNGERTMTTANTRWPIWSWTDGPFPREEAAPERSKVN
jgi:hypothetical protein